MKLDLACGRNLMEGFAGVDVRDLPGVEWLVDLSAHPWPWGDNSVEEMICNHYVEHVVDLVGFMNEAHRVLVPGGTFTITHPYQHSDRAWQDPTHVRALNMVSWAYFDSRSSIRVSMGEDYDAITADFEITSVTAVVAPDMMEAFPDGIPEEVLRHSVNVIDDLAVVLKKRGEVTPADVAYGIDLLDAWARTK